MNRTAIVVLLLLSGIFLSACDSRTSASPAAMLPPAPKDSVSVPAKADSTPAAEAARTLSFAFVGDIMMGTTYPEEPRGAYLPPDSGRQLFADVAGILRSADIAAGNLEGTLLDGGGTVKKCKDPKICYAFRTPTPYVRNLTDAGIDFVSVANNHINDFGAAGIVSTLRTLDDAGIRYAGLRRDGARTATLERKGLRIGFAAFSPSGGTMSINDLVLLRNTVKELKSDHDIVVVSFHGGAEGPAYSHVPHASETAFGENRGNVEKFAHTAVDAGADIVYGHGPHVARAAELYKDRIIFYSLGNFCTPYRVSVAGISGHAPVAEIEVDSDGKFLRGKIHSFIQHRGKGPRADVSGSVAAQIRRLSREDFPASRLQIAPDGILSR